jgi:hypothetical protein
MASPRGALGIVASTRVQITAGRFGLDGFEKFCA